MGFNKRYISEKSIKSIAICDDYNQFFNYFKSDAIIATDNFSIKILDEIINCSLIDKDKIIEIMNKCK